MGNIKEYISPDGVLRLLIVTCDDGDVAIGFDGSPWHTHADILARTAGISEQEAIEKFMQDLFSSRTVIAVSRIDGNISDIWLTDDPQEEIRLAPPEESIELRYWDGKRFSA